VILEELRLVMFCVGASHVGDLWSDARLTRAGGTAA
jgi:isopentenyl diphosphate isomerase/L-lactate dehydrogenase-like FMN-dependent dehydrogenase